MAQQQPTLYVEAHIDVPVAHGVGAAAYGSVDPQTGALSLYSPEIGHLIHRAKASYQSSVALGVYGATVHFRPDGQLFQSTTNGGVRSVFGAVRMPPNRRIRCRVYFNNVAQSWYLRDVLAAEPEPVADPSVAARDEDAEMAAAAPPAAPVGGGAAVTTRVGVLADVSGSMHQLYRRVIESAIEQFVMPQRSLVAHDILFYGGTFADHLEMVYGGVDLRQQSDVELRERFYAIVPNGSTALRDAVQDFVARMETGASAGDEFVLCIVTDGHDNRSTSCTAEALRALIDAKNAVGVEDRHARHGRH